MSVDFGLLTDLSQIEKLFKRLGKIEDGFGFDIEGGYDGPPIKKGSLHPETAFVAGVSVSGDPTWARYIPLRSRFGSGVDEVDFARLLAQLLGSGKGIAHHAKHELRHLARFFRERLTPSEMREAGLDERDGYFPVFSDSMIEAYILGEFRAHGLKYLTGEVFGWEQAEITDLFPPMTADQKASLRFSDLDLTPAVVSYACDDAAGALALSRLHRPRVENRLLYRVEMSLVPILSRMEDYGVAFDWASMARVKQEAEQFIDLMRIDIMHELARLTEQSTVDINLGSPAQVSDMLYNKLKFSTTRMTKGSDKTAPKMSTDEKALAGLAKKHDIVQRILHWREMRKLIDSYLTKFARDFTYAKDGRTHPSHSQTSVVSGRFAVSDPPYQQLPKKYHFIANDGEFKLKFRDFVVAGPEHFLIGFDYSQVELRVMAGLSGESSMMKAFNDDVDIHVATASLMFGVPIHQVTDEQRGMGKTQNFAIGFGQGPKGIAERLGITVGEAKDLFEKYFATFPSLKSWISKQTREGVEQGFTVSKFGRKHPIWQLESDKPAIRATGERLCVNAPVQGGAADMMKIAMVRSDRVLRDNHLDDVVHLIMNIHDALVWEAHISVNPQTIIDLVHPEVCLHIDGWPKIKADWEVGMRWGSMSKLSLDVNNQIIVPERELAQVG